MSQIAFCTLLSEVYWTQGDVQGILYYKVHVLLLYVHTMYVVSDKNVNYSHTHTPLVLGQYPHSQKIQFINSRFPLPFVHSQVACPLQWQFPITLTLMLLHLTCSGNFSFGILLSSPCFLQPHLAVVHPVAYLHPLWRSLTLLHMLAMFWHIQYNSECVID